MLLILEVSRATEIILAIIVFVISLLGMIAGWEEGRDGKNAEKPAEEEPRRKGNNMRQ